MSSPSPPTSPSPLTSPTETTPAIPHPDKIHLRLLLVSGKKAEFQFTPEKTIQQVKEYVFQNWPIEWKGEEVEKLETLRVLHRGRFLEDTAVLQDNHMPLGHTTTVHLVPRPKVQGADPPATTESKSLEVQRGCRCVIE